MKLKRIGRMFGIAMAAMILLCGFVTVPRNTTDSAVSVLNTRMLPSQQDEGASSVRFAEHTIRLDLGGETPAQVKQALKERDKLYSDKPYAIPEKGGYVVRILNGEARQKLDNAEKYGMNAFYNRQTNKSFIGFGLINRYR